MSFSWTVVPRKNEYAPIIDKMRFIIDYLNTLDSDEPIEISSISLDDFKKYIDNFKKLLQINRNDMIAFVKDIPIDYYNASNNNDYTCTLSLENLVIIYKYILDVYDNDKCIHYICSYTDNIFNDFYLHYVCSLTNDSDYINAKCISDEKRSYLINNIDKQDFIEFFDIIIDNMNILSMFLSVHDLTYSYIDINKLLMAIFRLNHNKEWICKTINKVFSRLTEFSKEDKTKYYKIWDKDDVYYEDDIEYNKLIDKLYEQIFIFEKCSYMNCNFDERNKIISQLYDIMKQQSVNYLSL